MHNHNDNDSKMMWWMMIGCMLPVILLLFAGRVGDGSWFKWAILGAFVLMAGFHLFGMRHGKNGNSNQSNSPESKPIENDKHHH